MPDYSEVMETFARRQKAQATNTGTPSSSALAAHMRGSRMVALKLEELLKSDEWNTFLAHVKALLAADEIERDGLRTRFEQGELSPDELVKISNKFQRLIGRIEARTEDLDLPRIVITQDQDMQATYKKILDNEGEGSGSTVKVE